MDVRRVLSGVSFVCLLSGVLELSKGPLDLAEEGLEGGDGGVDLGRATGEAVTVKVAVAIRGTVPIRRTVAGPVRLARWWHVTVTADVTTITAVLALITEKRILGQIGVRSGGGGCGASS